MRQGARDKAVEELICGLDYGLDLGLVVHAGHGLTYRNIQPLAALGGFEEFNIGHSIVSRAVFVGLREAVREMKRLLRGALPHVAVVDTNEGGA